MSKRLEQIDFSWTKREILIDTILEFAWDEFESDRAYIMLAKKSESELYAELQDIKEYFVEDNEVEYDKGVDLGWQYDETIADIDYVLQKTLTM